MQFLLQITNIAFFDTAEGDPVEMQNEIQGGSEEDDDDSDDDDIKITIDHNKIDEAKTSYQVK